MLVTYLGVLLTQEMLCALHKISTKRLLLMLQRKIRICMKRFKWISNLNILQPYIIDKQGLAY